MVSYILFTCSCANNSRARWDGRNLAPCGSCVVEQFLFGTYLLSGIPCNLRKLCWITGVVTKDFFETAAMHLYRMEGCASTTSLKLSGSNWWLMIALTGDGSSIALCCRGAGTILFVSALKIIADGSKPHFPGLKSQLNVPDLHFSFAPLWPSEAVSMNMLRWEFIYFFGKLSFRSQNVSFGLLGPT